MGVETDPAPVTIVDVFEAYQNTEADPATIWGKLSSLYSRWLDSEGGDKPLNWIVQPGERSPGRLEAQHVRFNPSAKGRAGWEEIDNREVTRAEPFKATSFVTYIPDDTKFIFGADLALGVPLDKEYKPRDTHALAAQWRLEIRGFLLTEVEVIEFKGKEEHVRWPRAI